VDQRAARGLGGRSGCCWIFGAPVVFDRLLLRPAEGYAAQFPAALRVESTGPTKRTSPALLLDEVGLAVAEDATLERRFAPVEARWLRV
jgi:hypothetical protein